MQEPSFNWKPAGWLHLLHSVPRAVPYLHRTRSPSLSTAIILYDLLQFEGTRKKGRTPCCGDRFGCLVSDLVPKSTYVNRRQLPTALVVLIQQQLALLNAKGLSFGTFKVMTLSVSHHLRLRRGPLALVSIIPFCTMLVDPQLPPVQDQWGKMQP